ncbi:hypothetical protein Zmor_018371 [Zophobas morio]|uniref:Uncharacterized protein n=1 Tax=Zophobas morio TaxID=2755281 RepID=A0AA38MDG6_9CUCU|nr:hypothetical protein Zmor_018371 [Zophobas morio]
MECGQLNFAYCLSEIQILNLIAPDNSGVVWRGRGGVDVLVRVVTALARLPTLADSEFTQLPYWRGQEGQPSRTMWAFTGSAPVPLRSLCAPIWFVYFAESSAILILFIVVLVRLLIFCYVLRFRRK